jgi:hypothetical protein
MYMVMDFDLFSGIWEYAARADKSVVMRINLSAAVRESPVMLSAAKHLGPANEILRFAQDDKWRR